MSCPAPDPVTGLVLAAVLLALLVAQAVAVIVIMRRLRAGRDTTAGAAGVARSWRGASVVAARSARPMQGREEPVCVAASRPDPPRETRHAAELPDADLLRRAQDAARGITPARRWPRI